MGRPISVLLRILATIVAIGVGGAWLMMFGVATVMYAGDSPTAHDHAPLWMWAATFAGPVLAIAGIVWAWRR